jgi:hypothetical protein
MYFYYKLWQNNHRYMYLIFLYNRPAFLCILFQRPQVTWFHKKMSNCKKSSVFWNITSYSSFQSQLTFRRMMSPSSGSKNDRMPNKKKKNRRWKQVGSRTIFALLLALLGAHSRRSLINADSLVISDALTDPLLNLNMLKSMEVQNAYTQ